MSILMCFVFGSNEEGRHGKGAAKYALQYYGAEYGVAEGRTGLCYALPTVGKNLRKMPLDKIEVYVQRFIAHAKDHPETTFKVTRVGCGLAGHHDKDITPFFQGAPENCLFDEAWRPYLGDHRKYWGHVP